MSDGLDDKFDAQFFLELFEGKNRLDKALKKSRNITNKIKRKHDPRQRFNRWRDSSSGNAWKRKKYEQQGKCCAICGCFIPLKYSHIDHIQPLSKAPELACTLENLQITCADCNERKGDRT